MGSPPFVFPCGYLRTIVYKTLPLKILVWSVLREYGTLQQVRFLERGSNINLSIRRISLLHVSKAVDLEKNQAKIP